ncbi:hypothetical protein [Capillimicrobium parvum]|uniref:Uncharacterized protein n=1 Tax=Capillimicrobium parvum TaxID=2884022 RepID=A0A9E7BZE3_9ACTN|nr:hypothetical protein DSM104329_00679 [Capillimicrobium parvum]
MRPDVVGLCGSDLHLVEGHLEYVGVRMPVIQGPHEFPLDRTGEALAFAIENPSEVMKVVIRGF